MYRSCNCARRTTHNRSGFIYLGMGFLSFINWIGALGFKGDLVYEKSKEMYIDVCNILHLYSKAFVHIFGDQFSFGRKP